MKEPLYIQISKDIYKKIKTGEIPYGTRLPSERDLAGRYMVDRKTLRKAIALLKEEGILVSMRGKGLYICEPQIPYQVEVIDDLEQMILRNGMEVSTRVLFTEKREAGKKYGELLGVDEKEEIFRMIRLRMGNGEPIALMDTYVVSKLIVGIEELDFEIYSLYSVMEKNDIEVYRIDETFTFAELSNPEAAMLNLEENSIVFIAEDQSYDRDNRIVEYTKSMINNQKLSIDVSLRL